MLETVRFSDKWACEVLIMNIGNFHAQMLFEGPEDFEKAHEVSERMVQRALALDGTCTYNFQSCVTRVPVLHVRQAPANMVLALAREST